MTTYEPASVPLPTTIDLALIGAALLNAVAATMQLGHTTPAETLDYSHLDLSDPDSSAASWIVRDFIAWTGRQDLAEGAEDRLRDFVDASGWRQELAKSMTSHLTHAP